MVKMLDSNIIVSKFEHQSGYDNYFWTTTVGRVITPLPSYELNSITAVLGQVWHQSLMKVDMPLNKETKSKYSSLFLLSVLLHLIVASFSILIKLL